MARPWVLAVDLGTTGLKVGAVAEDGEILASAHAELLTYVLEGADAGGVEQDPESWWDAIRAGVRRMVGAEGLDPEALLAVGVTGQFGSTVPVDADGRAVGRCLVWADDRGGPLSRRQFGGPVAGYRARAILPWLRITGGAPSPNGADPSGHALFLRAERPEVHRRAAVLLEPVDYLGLRLTGRAAATPASTVAWWLTDNRPGARPGYHPGLVRRAGRDPAKLPELLPTGSVLGRLSPGAADDLGLQPGPPVVAGVPDFVAAYLASGTLDDFAAHVTIGTTSWVSCAVPVKKTDILHQIASVPGLRPGRYLMINNHETAGAALHWLRDGVLGGDYEQLTALAAQSAAGAGGVLFTPWLKGERSPVDDRSLRAAFLNVSLDTDRADLVRAVLEGVAHNLRWLVEAADRFTGRRLEPLRILGGGAVSDLWCQIHADVLGRRIERVPDPGAAQLRGAALVALLGTGRVGEDDLAARVPAPEVFDPDPDARAVYEPVYQEYRRLYGRLKGLYRRLNG